MMEPQNTQITETKTELAITLSERHAAAVMQNVDTLTTNFKTWMEEDVDYTRKLFGGSNKPSLLDPGAHKLTNFFQAYPNPTILEKTEEREPGRERIKYIIRADIIHISETRIGSGIGSCTTDESKYQYRWLTEYKLKDLGLTTEGLPSQERRGNNGNYRVYRIRNPEILDLDNTILKMATKRAEVDATLSLPGVSGVFTQDIEQYPDALGINDTPQQKPAAKTGPAPKQKPRKAENQTKIKEPTPQQDPDENRVITTFLDNDLRTTGLIIKKKDESVWIQHPTGFTEDQFNKHQTALDEAGFNSQYHPDKNSWEVSL